MAIFITGDTHGDFSRLLPAAFHEQRDLTKEDYLIICGDFGGVWDGGDAEQQWLDWLETRSFTTLFVSGNHENYDLLRNYPISQWHGGLVQAIRPSVLHLMRGQLYNICGKRIFTMGGASSHDIRDGILADLGCGTGELTLMLTQAGYDMIGIDQSEEMLCVVRDKAEQLGLSGKLLLLQQDLLKLDLYGTIRGAVSTFDTFNHIPDLDTAIANAAFFMEEGGVFLFDMNTPYKHQKVLGENVFTFEEEDAACVWRNHYHPADRRVEITVDIDYRETGEHFHEQFYEYTYDLDTIRAALEKHGFVLEKVCDGESFGPLTEESERYFFCAVKQYTQLEEKENV